MYTDLIPYRSKIILNTGKMNQEKKHMNSLITVNSGVDPEGIGKIHRLLSDNS